jgi:hypothetical protein
MLPSFFQRFHPQARMYWGLALSSPSNAKPNHMLTAIYVAAWLVAGLVSIVTE